MWWARHSSATSCALIRLQDHGPPSATLRPARAALVLGAVLQFGPDHISRRIMTSKQATRHRAVKIRKIFCTSTHTDMQTIRLKFDLS